MHPRQVAILDFAQAYIDENEQSPNYRQIGVACQMPLACVAYHVEQLIVRGMLARGSRCSRRTLRVPRKT